MNGNSSIALGYQNFAGGGGGLVFLVTLKGNRQLLLACCMLVFESEVIVIIQVYIGKFYIGQCLAIFIQHLHMLRALLLNKGIHFIMVGLVFYRVALVDDHVDFFTGVRQVYGELCTYTGVASVACKGNANLLGCALVTKGVQGKLQYVRLIVDRLPRQIRAASLVGDGIVTGILQIRGERFCHDFAQSVSDGRFNLSLAHAGEVIHFAVLILQLNEGLCGLGSDLAVCDAGALGGRCFREGESMGAAIKAGAIVVHGNRFITKLSLG